MGGPVGLIARRRSRPLRIFRRPRRHTRRPAILVRGVITAPARARLCTGVAIQVAKPHGVELSSGSTIPKRPE
jgi:hypothetical protein